MSDPMDPEVEVVDDESADAPPALPPEKVAELATRAGTSVLRVYVVGDHTFVLRKPKRAEHLRYRAQLASDNIDTRVRAAEMLAKACLVPYEATGKVEDERTAFDELAEEAPGIVSDVFGGAAVRMAFGERTFLEKKAARS